jgi:hypothetical protein
MCAYTINRIKDEAMKDNTKEKPKSRAKAKPKQVPIPQPRIFSNHSIEDICKAGREYKSAAAEHIYNKQRASINRLSVEEVEKSQANVDKLRQFAINIHDEYLNQPDIKRAFAVDHLKALKNVKS